MLPVAPAQVFASGCETAVRVGDPAVAVEDQPECAAAVAVLLAAVFVRAVVLTVL